MNIDFFTKKSIKKTHYVYIYSEFGCYMWCIIMFLCSVLVRANKH